MGSRLLRKQTDTRRIIWRGDDALAEAPETRWVDAEFAVLKPGAVPTVIEVRGVGNAEMSRIYAMAGAGELQTEVARLLLVSSVVVAIRNGDDAITERAGIIAALEAEYPCQLYLDLAEEVQRMAEGGPPGARRFRSEGDPADAGADGAADCAPVQDLPA